MISAAVNSIFSEIISKSPAGGDTDVDKKIRFIDLVQNLINHQASLVQLFLKVLQVGILMLAKIQFIYFVQNLDKAPYHL